MRGTARRLGVFALANFRLDTPANAATVSVRFAGPGGLTFETSLEPQLAIFRLPPGQ